MRFKVTGRSNSRIRASRSLSSRSGILKHGLFLMEGPRYIRDQMKFSSPRWIMLSTEPTSHSQRVADEAVSAGVDVLDLSDDMFQSIADTVNSQGILGVFPLEEPEPDALQGEGVYILLDGVSDPGNVGTIIRSAAAFGCRAVITGKGCCCPFIPKVTRASAGTNGRIPVFMDRDLGEFINGHREEISFIGADAGGGPMDLLWKSCGKLGIVIGSEAEGISSRIRPLLKATVSIPMEAGVESLNAGVSASIILYQATRV